MAEYRLSQAAKMDLIRIHHFGVQRFGMAQADKYFNSFFQYFEIIAKGLIR
ncbi:MULTISPECIES: type II toxin-antitoxin system RelE/ParE family toxin [unclassified Algoriphagus]|jgi:toxin ParE1/3/4|uniref:type II toxin-antitoxin system RelE/ParE family toxin n=1 Tax=unclassified Algoriphagus TaxID=2641541 RepID=UPI001C63B1A7|nr:MULTISPECIES: type II toxin-antitoxin system RelE/ParE family toxin [unclassified Algoriphagus]|tara:strand:+ start:2621 stop:2773 length:153 start_codon:yes stop_codon:yes gene_type:complete